MIKDTVREILVGLGIPEADITDDAHLRKDLELDSTETVEVSLELKRRLGAQVKLEAKQDPTVGEVCRRVEAALDGAPLPQAAGG